VKKSYTVILTTPIPCPYTVIEVSKKHIVVTLDFVNGIAYSLGDVCPRRLIIVYKGCALPVMGDLCEMFGKVFDLRF